MTWIEISGLKQGRRQKIFKGGGAIRTGPVLTTKNGRIFEIWSVKERVCENPGGAWPFPAPPCRRPWAEDLFFFQRTPQNSSKTMDLRAEDLFNIFCGIPQPHRN